MARARRVDRVIVVWVGAALIAGVVAGATVDDGPSRAGYVLVRGTLDDFGPVESPTSPGPRPRSEPGRANGSATSTTEAGAAKATAGPGLGSPPPPRTPDPAPPATGPASSPSPGIPGFGAAPIGATAYPVPAGARFVAPHGKDDGPGSLATPWRTLAHAVTAAPRGTTIVLRLGVYRESVRLDQPLTVQPYPHEAVTLSGSTPIRGWVHDGNAWRHDGWTARPRGHVPSVLLDPAHPMAAHPDQVFLDGQPLRQVGSRAELGPGRFFVDAGRRRLYLGDNPLGHHVEASRLAEALTVRADGTVVRGLAFERYASTVEQKAAVKGYADDVVFENNVFTDNATAGLSVIGANARILRNTATRNGQMGIHAHTADRLLLEGNRVSGNNVEQFAQGAAAGGVKITAARHATVRDNLVEENLGKGIWFDVSSYATTIVRNITRDNRSAGLMYEASAGAIIAGNIAVGNDQGIYLLEANDVDVWNNTLLDNRRNLEILDGRRDSATGTGDPRFEKPYDPRHPYPDPDIHWNIDHVRIRNNVLAVDSAKAQWLLSVDDAGHKRSARAMDVTADYNAYYRRAVNNAPWTHRWSDWPRKLPTYRTVGDFRAAADQETHGLAVDGESSNPFVRDIGGGSYRLPPGSPARDSGQPLPPPIASALGTMPGTPVNVGALLTTDEVPAR